MEIWRDIQGYEGIYQVSNYGRVKSLERDVEVQSKLGRVYVRRQKEKIKEPHCLKKDYIVYDLWKNNEGDQLLAHVLVAKAFIPNPHGYTVVHHKNYNRQDNQVENLMWMDEEEHRKLHDKERCKRVDQIDAKTGEVLHQWESVSEAADALGYDQGNICKCCSDRYQSYKTYKNYIWKYANY